MRRAQFVLEFIIALTIVILVGVIYLAIATDVFTRTSDEQRIASLNDVGYAIQDELILAAQVADGYNRTFVVPSLADRFTYTLSSDATTVTLMSGSAILTYDIPPVVDADGDGQFIKKGSNRVSKNGMLGVWN